MGTGEFHIFEGADGGKNDGDLRLCAGGAENGAHGMDGAGPDWTGRSATLAGLDWVAAQRSGAAALPAHLPTGIEGEDAAFFYLRRKGYVVVARRWSSGDLPGDVDLIAWQGRCCALLK